MVQAELVQIWDFLTARSLFHQPTKPYVTARHLAEMIGLFGDIPSTLAQRATQFMGVEICESRGEAL
jgi:hypothetical protein